MSATTSIAWTDRTWNPVRGCTRVSAGCENCYAERQAARFAGPGMPYAGLVRIGKKGPRWAGTARLISSALAEPLKWKKPQRIFVNSMSDLFHESLSNDEIAAVFGVMAAAKQHTFQVLTKRPERMLAWFEWLELEGAAIADCFPTNRAWHRARVLALSANADRYRIPHDGMEIEKAGWPLPNVHLGVSVENQATADERIPLLLQTPAAVRFVSAEPLLEAVKIPRFIHLFCGVRGYQPLGNIVDAGLHRVVRDWTGARFIATKDEVRISIKPNECVDVDVDWVIVGGESGPGARSCNVEWIRSIIADCKAVGVPCFVKQFGAHPLFPGGLRMSLVDRKGANPLEWPNALRVRQFPDGRP